ncbi:hypothetical protein FOFC_11411 [Fusarium oxysporum]|nr:hypothetical protein FOFC_11411 [Fusarium oxysporum]
MVGGATGSLERLAESSVRQATPKGDVNEEGPGCDSFRPRRLRGHGASTGFRRGIAEHLKLERSEFGNA